MRLVELNVFTRDSWRPKRVIVRVSSSPSSRLRAALGLIVSSHFTQARSSFKAFSGVALAQAPRKRQVACCRFSKGRCSTTLRSLCTRQR